MSHQRDQPVPGRRLRHSRITSSQSQARKTQSNALTSAAQRQRCISTVHTYNTTIRGPAGRSIDLAMDYPTVILSLRQASYSLFEFRSQANVPLMLNRRPLKMTKRPQKPSHPYKNRSRLDHHLKPQVKIKKHLRHRTAPPAMLSHRPIMCTHRRHRPVLPSRPQKRTSLSLRNQPSQRLTHNHPPPLQL